MSERHPQPPDEVFRILHVEDDPTDRELARATLAADGLSCRMQCVDARPEFEAALLSETFDIILADYRLPRFDGLTAQAIARRMAPQTPFIFLSATLGEELAIDRLKEGATDYVLKQRIGRLPAAVRRARREASERTERQRAEADVRRLNAELEARVADRSAALAVATETLARREQQWRESDQLLQAILDHSPMAMTVMDLNDRYLLVSRQAEAFLGRQREALIGVTSSEVVAPRIADIYRAHDLEVIRAKRSAQFEEPFFGADGLGVLASTRFPLLDASGDVYAVCCVSAEITARKKSEDEVRLARLEAERANLAKSEFLSRMSHDLRTPLNAILGFAQLLELESLGAEQADNVRQILSGGRHLLDLINEVLDITRIESGNLSLSTEPVPVAELIRQTVSLIKPLAAQRHISVEMEPLPHEDEVVLADRQRLTQVLINLLSNAVKYNRVGGRVTIAFVAGSRKHRQPSRLTVTDTGAGIPPENLKLLFQPFERLGAEQTSTEGTGLGLALSRALAQAMGGRLGVDTEIDRGSAFWIDLPAADPASAADVEHEQTTAATRSSEAKGTVLYVEDNMANVRLIERILRRRPGITLVHAPQGSVALSLVRSRRPDAILLDLHLPDMPGDEVLRQIWADVDTRSIPTVIVTADATPGIGRRLQAAGAAACLTKPLDIGDVLRVLDDLLGTPLEGDAHV
jgi:PAS domain S-box-containing protein